MEWNVVIGSYGSYNECNERALGSNWLDLSNYASWEDIKEELNKEGFELDGIDEELFVQDCEFLDGSDCEYLHPQKLFEILKDSGVLDNEYMEDYFEAYMEVNCWRDFVERVESMGEDWTADIYLYKDYDWEDYGRERFWDYFPSVDKNLESELDNFFDFEEYGKYLGQDYVEEYSDGLVEIL